MALTLDKAIKHCYEVADKKCDDCGKEHLQLAKWLEELKRLKSADVTELKQGMWISLTDCANAGVYCSVCHKKVYKEDYAWCNKRNKLRSNYCPNCGADMRGGKTE